MTVTVRIPPTLRTETGGEREVPATGSTVREVLDDLMTRFPGLRSQLVEDDDIAPFVNVYVEGEDVRTLDGLETPVGESATVILLPAMAGGSAEPPVRSRVIGESLLDLVGNTPLIGRLMLYDALDATFTEVALRRDPDCPVCGEHPTISEYIDYVEFCAAA